MQLKDIPNKLETLSLNFLHKFKIFSVSGIVFESYFTYILNNENLCTVM